MSRDARQWNDYRAHIKITEGDPAECHIWYGVALNRLKFLLSNRPGSVTDTMSPSSGVLIRIDTRPNRIHIKAGVIDYITIMAPSGTASGYDYSNRLVPPWQPIQQRLFFKTPTSVQQASYALYGGNKSTITATESGANFPGGYWSDEKSLACSWTFNTLFVQGKYCSVHTEISTGHYDAQIKRVVLIPPYTGHLTNAASGGLAVDLVALVFYTFVDITPSVISGTKLMRFDLIGLTGSGDSFSAFASPDLTDATLFSADSTQEQNVAVSDIFIQGTATNFTPSTRSFFWLEEVASAGDRVTQKIIRRTFDATFSSYMDATIYEHVVVGFSYGAAYALLTGEPILCHMQTEGDNVGLVRANITSVTGHKTKGTDTKDQASTIVRTYQLVVMKNDGTLAVAADGFATTTIDTSAVGIAPTSPASDVTYDTSDDVEELWLMAYSATRKVVCYAIYHTTWTDAYSSTASTNSKITDKTFKFDLYLRYSAVTTKIYDKAIVTEHTETTFSIPSVRSIIQDYVVTTGNESLPPVTFEVHAKAVSRTMFVVCYNGEITITVLVDLFKPATYRTLAYRIDYSSSTTAFSPMSVVPGVFTLGTIASTTIT